MNKDKLFNECVSILQILISGIEQKNFMQKYEEERAEKLYKFFENTGILEFFEKGFDYQKNEEGYYKKNSRGDIIKIPFVYYKFMAPRTFSNILSSELDDIGKIKIYLSPFELKLYTGDMNEEVFILAFLHSLESKLKFRTAVEEEKFTFFMKFLSLIQELEIKGK